MLSNNSGNESVVDPLSITSEITLIGVELVLTSTIIPPFFLIYLGNFAEGLTKVDVPTTNIKSDLLTTSMHLVNTDFGIGSPNKTVSNFIIPPQLHVGGNIEVSTKFL